MRPQENEIPEFDPGKRYWVRRRDLWPLLFTEETGFDKWNRKIEGDRFKHSEASGENRGAWFYAPLWLRAWSDGSAGRQVESDGKSSHVDRLNKAKADKAEIELQAMLGDLVTRGEWEESADSLGRHVRSMGDRLIEKFGPEAERIIEEELAKFKDERDQQLEAHQ